MVGLRSIQHLKAAHPNFAIGHAMVRYLPEHTRVLKSSPSRSHPNPRHDFRPPAYVVLTRNVRANRSERQCCFSFFQSTGSALNEAQPPSQP